MSEVSIDRAELRTLIREGYISETKHPEEALWIYNYTAKCQYEQKWNQITLQCRGLILDANHNIVARPFKKIFNYGEVKEVTPKDGFRVFDKMDGSLGILYWVRDMPFIATRGSFTSEQAEAANTFMRTRYRRSWDKLPKDKTVLFEIIYPENRIVVDYEDFRGLVVLGVIDTKTGMDETPIMGLGYYGFPAVQEYDGINDYTVLTNTPKDNFEGYVILFKSGYRVKLKMEEYVRLHKIVTQVSNLTIWEHLKDGKQLDEVLDRVPDEFFNYVKDTAAEIQTNFNKIYAETKMAYTFLEPCETRKDMAEQIKKYKYADLLFALLDGKEVDDKIWRMCRPRFERPFSNEYKQKQLA